MEMAIKDGEIRDSGSEGNLIISMALREVIEISMALREFTV